MEFDNNRLCERNTRNKSSRLQKAIKSQVPTDVMGDDCTQSCNGKFAFFPYERLTALLHIYKIVPNIIVLHLVPIYIPFRTITLLFHILET